MRGSNRRKLAEITRGLVLATLIASVVAMALFTPIASGIRNGDEAVRTSSVGIRNERMEAPPATMQPPTLKWVLKPYYGAYLGGSSTVVADVDGDNKPEIIANAHYIYCLTGTGQVKWTGQRSGYGFSTPGVADLDGDGKQEIVVSGAYAHSEVFCLDSTGRNKWISNTSYHFVESEPAIADIDGDGQKEILTGSSSWQFYNESAVHPGYLVCFTGLGAVKWAYTTGESLFDRPAVTDIEGDGKIDILVGATFQGIVCLNSTGARLWNFTVGGGIPAPPVVTDIDGDGSNEILFSAGRSLYCLSSSHVLKWTYDAGSTCVLSSNVTDIDSDEELEIVLGARGGEVICISATGGKEWSYPTASPIGGRPVVADVNGDNQPDIIAGTMENSSGATWQFGGVVCCLNGLGNLEWTYAIGSSIYAALTVADVDGDVKPEILAVSDFRGLYCLSTYPGTTSLGLVSLPLISVGLVVVAIVAAAQQARKRRTAPGRATRRLETQMRL
jgi:hypothetical protein